ncbi:hypothetical protein [Tumebacillus permanentifrigoris]|uniref:Uncharacterized protein n=1 Tax=Tumebacillus permanentifrigoris TaxID=378543 RepID=A0A316DZN8_9BACL|nr:hypothetical protein [Tumebacillus permanentifrigoris]PWK16010.1 hypothetical protein C7459_102256 [Tumebacillus permanentifrigoris]
MKKTAEQKEPVDQLIAKIYELAKQVSEHPNEILKLQTSEFVRSFIDLTQAVEHLDAARELLLGRAESLLSRPRDTEKRLRKEHLKLVINNQQ